MIFRFRRWFPKGLGSGGLGATPHAIVSIRDNGSSHPRFTTAAAHGLTTGNTVSITGTGNAFYDGFAGEDVTVVSAKVFDLNVVDYDADANGGTWSRP